VDVTATNELGKTARVIAIEKGHLDAAAVLEHREREIDAEDTQHTHHTIQQEEEEEEEEEEDQHEDDDEYQGAMLAEEEQEGGSGLSGTDCASSYVSSSIPTDITTPSCRNKTILFGETYPRRGFQLPPPTPLPFLCSSATPGLS